MTDDIEKTLDRLPKASPPPELEARIAASIGTIRPVRPLRAPGARALAAAAVGIVTTLAVAWIAVPGFRPMNATQWAVFGALSIAAGGGAWIASRLAVPGAAPPTLVRAAFLLVPLALAVVVVAVLGTAGGFGPAACLQHGLVAAVVPWIASMALLARGFPTAPVLAGGIAGMVAGLWGVSMLQLTCPTETGPHLMLWHGGVLVVAALAGALAGTRI